MVTYKVIYGAFVKAYQLKRVTELLMEDMGGQQKTTDRYHKTLQEPRIHECDMT